MSELYTCDNCGKRIAEPSLHLRGGKYFCAPRPEFAPLVLPEALTREAMKRYIEWVTAIAMALGNEGKGMFVPLKPDEELFRKMFDLIRLQATEGLGQ